MHEQTAAERYLLEEIRRGATEGSPSAGEAWSQLVDRYQGRLIAFARRRTPRSVDPEDLVQDTFFQFLRGLQNYRGEASLETFLFLILRRKIADIYRSGGHTEAIQLGLCEGSAGNNVADKLLAIAAPDPTASWYVRRDEQRDAARSALAAALWSLVRKMQDEVAFQDLQIAELIFYAQWKNQQISAAVGVEASHVGMLKHRWLRQLQERVAQHVQHRIGDSALPWDTPDLLDSLLTEIWEEHRPSCPKRSTLGGFVLETLDSDWMRYVDFHVNHLKCSVCSASLDDIRSQNQVDPRQLHRRILQSTVGFLRPAQ